MKKIIGGLLSVVLLCSTATYALSCAGEVTFDDMYAESSVAFRGTLVKAELDADMSEKEYCEGLSADTSTLGTHTFTFEVDETLKGTVGSSIEVTREVTGVNCTRGGSCVDLVVGEEYVVLTDETGVLGDGLCRPCPYMLASEFAPPVKEPCICTMEYDPMCGVDGVTYGNACGLACAGTELAYSGECEETYIDASCTSWYDGCNTCTVVDGKVGACTKMACFVHEREKCLEHDFQYVGFIHEIIIKQTIDAYFADMTYEERQEAIQKLLTKIDTKRKDIQYILSVSLFMQGSTELKRYHFQLEILAAIESML